MMDAQSDLRTLRTRKPNRTFSSTVSHGNKAEPASWKNMTRSRPGPVIGTSSVMTEPLVTGSKAAIMLRSVDLPQPEGPNRQRSSPSLTVSDTPSSALYVPLDDAKIFCTLLTRNKLASERAQDASLACTLDFAFGAVKRLRLD